MAKYLDQAGLTKLWGIIINRFAEKGGTEESIADVLKQLNAFKNTAGRANGLAQLDGSGKVPSSQLPSYVDDVLEYANRTSFPATGQDGIIYIDEATNKTYRWSGTTYVEISASLALGETSSTAYAGNKGKANADAIAELKSQKVNKENTINGGTLYLAEPYVDSAVDAIRYDSADYSCGVRVNKNGEIGFWRAPEDGYTASDDDYNVTIKGDGIYRNSNNDDASYKILDESMALTTSEIEAICV